MSRINDALKKARQAHAATPPTAAGPELRPLRNPAPPPRRAISPRLFIILAAVILAVVACWFWFGSRGHQLKVRANAIPAIANPSPAPKVQAPAPPAPVAAVAAAPAPDPIAVVTAKPAPATNAPPAPLPTVAEAPPAIETSSSPPPTLILQGLFVRPRDPLAIINGQTVSVGGFVDDARVVAIDLHSATVVTANGRTNVLEMSNP